MNIKNSLGKTVGGLALLVGSYNLASAQEVAQNQMTSSIDPIVQAWNGTLPEEQLQPLLKDLAYKAMKNPIEKHNLPQGGQGYINQSHITNKQTGAILEYKLGFLDKDANERPNENDKIYIAIPDHNNKYTTKKSFTIRE